MDAAEIVKRRRASNGNPPCPIEGCKYTARGRMGLCVKHGALVPQRASIELVTEIITAQIAIREKHWAKWQAWVREQVQVSA